MAGTFREIFVKPFVRSSGWSKARGTHLAKNPTCANCGKEKMIGMQVHHKKPFHLFPELELDPTNFITLCDNPRCHLDKGHLGNWKSYNENVVQDAAIWLEKYKNRP